MLKNIKQLLDGHDNYYGCLVTKNNKIIYEKYVNNNRYTKFRIFSCTKPITGLAIVILIQQKIISLYDTLDKFNIYIPCHNIITIIDLLQHRSGVYDFISEFYFNMNPFNLFKKVIKKTHTEFLEFYTIVKEINNNTPYALPTKRYKYNNTAYDILGYIIYAVTGIYTDKFIKYNIFDNLNMNNSSFHHNNDEHEAKPYDNCNLTGVKEQQNWFCGNAFIVCTLRDYTKFLYNYGDLLNKRHLRVYENLYYFNHIKKRNKKIKYLYHTGKGDFSYSHYIDSDIYKPLSKSAVIKFSDTNGTIVTVVISENYRQTDRFFNDTTLDKLIDIIKDMHY